MSFDEIIRTKMSYLNGLMVRFRGLHEGKNYIKMLLSRLVRCNYKEFNLRGNENEMITIYHLLNNMGDEVWYKYDINSGLVKTTPESIFNLLQNGWNSRSLSLDDVLESSISR